MTTAIEHELEGPSGRLFPVMKLARDPKGAYSQWLEQYGDPCLVHGFNGDVVLTAKPELVRQIFAAPADTFVPFAPHVLAPILGPKSVFAMADKAHRDERKIIMPPLHGDRMRHYGTLIQEATARELSRLKPGQPVVMQKITGAISMDVIIRAIFGLTDEARIDKMRDILDRVMDRAHPALFFAPVTQVSMLGLSPWDRFKQAKAEGDAFIIEEIERRRAGGEQGEDILSMLLQARYEDGTPLDTDHILDQLVTLLVAGHETTSVSLAWAMDLLHRNPKALAELREALHDAESKKADETARVPLLKATCQEVLRLYPVLPAVLRQLAKPMTLGDQELEAGMVLAAAAVVTHRDPELYPNPEAFRPERFMGGPRRAWEYYPFGGGYRRCAGSAFAMYEMSLVLATMLGEHEFELTERAEVAPVRRNITMGPSTGVKMVYLGRRA